MNRMEKAGSEGDSLGGPQAPRGTGHKGDNSTLLVDIWRKGVLLIRRKGKVCMGKGGEIQRDSTGGKRAKSKREGGLQSRLLSWSNTKRRK